MKKTNLEPFHAITVYLRVQCLVVLFIKLKPIGTDSRAYISAFWPRVIVIVNFPRLITLIFKHFHPLPHPHIHNSTLSFTYYIIQSDDGRLIKKRNIYNRQLNTANRIMFTVWVKSTIYLPLPIIIYLSV